MIRHGEWKLVGKENEGSEEERFVLEHVDHIRLYIYRRQVDTNNIIALTDLIEKGIERTEKHRLREVAVVLAKEIIAQE